jgi:hypothetical protein
MVAAGAVGALLMGCTASVPHPEPPPSSRSAEAPVAYARDTIVGTVAGATVVARPGTFSGLCQPMRAAERLAGFMAGFAEAPDQTLALVGTGFRWYSSGEHGPSERNLAAYTRDQLATLLSVRKAEHERQRLVAVALHETGDFTAVVARVANDLPVGRVGRVRSASGKGKVDCETGQLVVLSLVVNRPEASDFVSGVLVGLSEAQLRVAAAPAITELSRQPP